MMWSVLFLQYMAHSNQFLITPGSLEKGTMLIVWAKIFGHFPVLARPGCL